MSLFSKLRGVIDHGRDLETIACARRRCATFIRAAEAVANPSPRLPLAIAYIRGELAALDAAATHGERLQCARRILDDIATANARAGEFLATPG